MLKNVKYYVFGFQGFWKCLVYYNIIDIVLRGKGASMQMLKTMHKPSAVTIVQILICYALLFSKLFIQWFKISMNFKRKIVASFKMTISQERKNLKWMMFYTALKNLKSWIKLKWVFPYFNSQYKVFLRFVAVRLLNLVINRKTLMKAKFLHFKSYIIFNILMIDTA